MIKNAIFTSVWDGGYEIKTQCKVDMDTNQVFNIESVDVGNIYEECKEEYITIDEENYPVFRIGSNFWYE